MVVDADSRLALNFGLAAVVYQWARGMSFKDITQMTMVRQITEYTPHPMNTHTF